MLVESDNLILVLLPVLFPGCWNPACAVQAEGQDGGKVANSGHDAGSRRGSGRKREKSRAMTENMNIEEAPQPEAALTSRSSGGQAERHPRSNQTYTLPNRAKTAKCQMPRSSSGSSRTPKRKSSGFDGAPNSGRNNLKQNPTHPCSVMAAASQVIQPTCTHARAYQLPPSRIETATHGRRLVI